MKSLLVILLMTIGQLSFGQEAQFLEAIKTSSFNEVMPYLDNRLELCIDDDQDLYTRTIVVNKIKQWIGKVGVKGVKSMHGGAARDNSSYYKVAKIDTNKGAYRLFIYMEGQGASTRIKKIQIDTY